MDLQVLRQQFFQHVGQTSDAPLGLPILKAEGSFLFLEDGTRLLDLISGISVGNTGHCHPGVVKAIQEQASRYLHVMVYGETIQGPQVQFASLLAQQLPASLNSVFFTNSGAEATEGAMKLAKRATGKSHFLAFRNSYHGSSQGALSLMGNEYYKQAFRPLLPGVRFADFNDFSAIDRIGHDTAAVFIEPVQSESGYRTADTEWLKAIRKKCDETCTLLVFDEVQTGFGRTGKLFALEHSGVIPDILLMAKGMGGGMPLGAFVADRKLMGSLSHDPVLGHISTFGGHPVSCAAGLASLQAILSENMLAGVAEREQIIRKHLSPFGIQGTGLMWSLPLPDFETNQRVIQECLAQGILTDWFLHAPDRLRITPALNIPIALLEDACQTITRILRHHGQVSGV